MNQPGRTAEVRLEELETRLTFQDDLIDSLNDTIARQDRELLELARRLAALESKFDDLAAAGGLPGERSDREVPPHY